MAEIHSTSMSCTAPAKNHAEDDPQSGGQVAHLRGQDRADERSGAGDAGKVLAEEHAASVRSKFAPSCTRSAGVAFASSVRMILIWM